VGNERNVEIDIFRVELETGDRILLCTDGLWGEVEDAEIESILNHSDNNRIVARELIRAAHQGGGKDNISVVIANIPGEASADV
jgi:protein phosphatase